jgi:hypothetical protein
MSQYMNSDELDSFLLLHKPIKASMNWRIPVHQLIDSAYCKRISTLLQQNGARWERKEATRGLGKIWVPEKTGLYMFVWTPELAFDLANPVSAYKCRIPLYVGRAMGTNTLKKRYVEEYQNHVQGDVAPLWEERRIKNRKERLDKYLSLRPLEYWCLTVDDDDKIAFLEERLIWALNPPANKEGTLSASKAGKSHKVWRNQGGK